MAAEQAAELGMSCRAQPVTERGPGSSFSHNTAGNLQAGGDFKVTQQQPWKNLDGLMAEECKLIKASSAMTEGGR